MSHEISAHRADRFFESRRHLMLRHIRSIHIWCNWTDDRFLYLPARLLRSGGGVGSNSSRLSCPGQLGESLHEHEWRLEFEPSGGAYQLFIFIWPYHNIC